MIIILTQVFFIFSILKVSITSLYPISTLEVRCSTVALSSLFPFSWATLSLVTWWSSLTILKLLASKAASDFLFYSSSSSTRWEKSLSSDITLPSFYDLSIASLFHLVAFSNSNAYLDQVEWWISFSRASSCFKLSIPHAMLNLESNSA